MADGVARDWHGGLDGAAQDTLAGLLGDVFARFGVTAVLDVGAHAGGYRDFLRGPVGFAGRVLSFEPQPGLGAELDERAAADRAWEVRHVALGAEPGRCELSLHAGSTLASLHRLNEDGRALLQGAPERGAVEVEVRTLDGCWDELGLDGETVFLKCDTQGHELEVLRGAGARLDGVVGLQLEVAVTPLYAGMPGWREVLDETAARGFVASGLYLVNRAPDLRAVEFDLVAVRPPG